MDLLKKREEGGEGWMQWMSCHGDHVMFSDGAPVRMIRPNNFEVMSSGPGSSINSNSNEIEEVDVVDVEGIKKPLERKSNKSMGTTQQVDTAYGTLNVTVNGPTPAEFSIITYHDIGLNHRTCFESFFNYLHIKELFSRFTVYHIDAPYQGEDDEEVEYEAPVVNMEQMVEQVQQVVDHFKIATFIGIGVGAGGTVLTHYAIKNPSIVDGLVLIGCTIKGPGWLEWTYQIAATYVLAYQGVTETVKSNLVERFFSWDTIENNPDLVQLHMEEFRSLKAYNLMKFIMGYMDRVDAQEDLANVNVPVLHFCGEKSYYLEDSFHLNSKLAHRGNTAHVTIPHSGNLVTEEAPREMVEPLFLFLRGMQLTTGSFDDWESNLASLMASTTTGSLSSAAVHPSNTIKDDLEVIEI